MRLRVSMRSSTSLCGSGRQRGSYCDGISTPSRRDQGDRPEVVQSRSHVPKVLSISELMAGAIRSCAGYGVGSAKEGIPAMTATKLSKEAFWAFFESHPGLCDRMASIVSAVENSEGNLEEADAAEARLVEEMRLLGREALQGWAEGRVEATEREVRLQSGMHR